MSYRLGVDLGTTYSSAATAVDGKAKIVTLGNRAAAMPSVVLARHDGTLLVGDAADRRGRAEPDRVAREFKRRFGDPTPLDLGGSKVRADQLMAAMLPPILESVISREGGPPDLVALTHPANWGQAKRTMLRQAAQGAAPQLSELMLVSEPEAAAIYYAETEHIAVGEVVAVYDLGGGTFDAAVLRRTATGFELMGPPEGIDRLGGVDFDAAVFAHVNRFLDGALDGLNGSDPTIAAGLSHLRSDCVEAKETLSADTDVTLPVLLPGLRTEVRMTRGEFESMIRPALGDTLGALKRAMRSAHVVASDIKVVLLVGGSSRIPLVAQMVGSEVGRPVAIDVHPKHAVALGAALAADVAWRLARDGAPAGAASPPVSPLASPPSTPPGPTSPGPAAPTPAAPTPAAPTPAPAPAPAAAAPTPPAAAPTAPAAGATTPAPAPAPSPAPAPPPISAGPPTVATTPARLVAAPSSPSVPNQPPDTVPVGADGARRRSGALIAALVGLVIGVVALVVVLNGRGGDDTATGADTTAAEPTDTTAAEPTDTTAPQAQSSTTAAAPTTSAAGPTTTVLPPECATDAQPFVCIFSVSKNAAGELVIPFKTFGYQPLIAARHIHFFFPSHPEIAADPLNAGSSGPNQKGNWVLWDSPNPFGPGGQFKPYTVAQAKAAGATSICVLVADSGHAVTPGTGNCLPIPPEVLA